MKNRPLLFILLGLFHILEPLFKVLYFKASTGFPLTQIFENILHLNSFKAVFEFWFLFPIGGIALLGIKKWSYPVFVSVQVYSIFTHINYESFTWPYVSQAPMWPSLAILSCNVAIILYFLMPEIRKPFFDRDMRWWEHRERYSLRVPCSYSVRGSNALKDAEILNISHSGAFMALNNKSLKEEESLTINISFLDQHISLNAKVISLHGFDHQDGVGIKFKYENIWEKLLMTKIIKRISKASKKHSSNMLAA